MPPKKAKEGPTVSAIAAPVNAPYVDPIKALSAATEVAKSDLSVRGKFSCEIYCHLVAAHTAKALNDPTLPALSLSQMKALAKEAVYSADVLLGELAASHNRRI